MPLSISIEAMRLEVLRELGFRERVYPRWVQQGKIRPEKAAEQTERMQAVLEVLEEVRLARAYRAAVLQAPGAPDNPEALRAWAAWNAPREAPLTTGAHARRPANA